MSALPNRLALAALRGMLQELEGDPTDAGEVLARVLAAHPPALVPAPALEPGAAPRRPGAPLAARPAQKPPAPRRRARSARPAAPAGGSEDVPELVRRLVEGHEGNAAAAARTIESSPQVLRRWKNGTPPTPAKLERLRAAVRALDQEQLADGGDTSEAPTEAAGLLAQLVERHGSLERVSDRLGLTRSALERVAAGGAAGPSTTTRLRAALAHPTPEEATPARAGAEVAAAGPSFRRGAASA